MTPPGNEMRYEYVYNTLLKCERQDRQTESDHVAPTGGNIKYGTLSERCFLRIAIEGAHQR